MSTRAGRLWDKGEALDAVVHRFTVGDDAVLDRQLVHWDCLGSAAHARALARAGVLTAGDGAALCQALAEIDGEAAAGGFTITAEQEDVHTAIEVALTERCGAAGARIHAGRSRNDQVATAMRLFMRQALLSWLAQLDELLVATLARGRRDGAIPMPGYTHNRPAMPSSVGQWLHALAEGLLDAGFGGLQALERLDACPLGSGAGYGVPLRLDRGYTAELLGFGRVQRSPMDVQNSRGRVELLFVHVGADVGRVLERMASDLVHFSGAEFGFFGLPAELTTGSSIMPQKRNPDVLELLRAYATRLPAWAVELELLVTRLTSGYHRDLQLTKEPVLRTAREVADMLEVAKRVVGGFTINADRLASAMYSELYATEGALARVQAGQPFREAYRAIAEELRAATFVPPNASPGTQSCSQVCDDTWSAVDLDRQRLAEQAAAWRERIVAAETALLPIIPDESVNPRRI